MIAEIYKGVTVKSDLVRHWDDVKFSAWAFFDPEYPDTHVTFRVYEITAESVVIRHPSGRVESFQRGYNRRGATALPDPVESPEDAEVFLSGSVKWDGCSDWDFSEDAYHFCGVEEAENIGVLFRRLYEWAKELGMDRA